MIVIVFVAIYSLDIATLDMSSCIPNQDYELTAGYVDQSSRTSICSTIVISGNNFSVHGLNSPIFSQLSYAIVSNLVFRGPQFYSAVIASSAEMVKFVNIKVIYVNSEQQFRQSGIIVGSCMDCSFINILVVAALTLTSNSRSFGGLAGVCNTCRVQEAFLSLNLQITSQLIGGIAAEASLISMNNIVLKLLVLGKGYNSGFSALINEFVHKSGPRNAVDAVFFFHQFVVQNVQVEGSVEGVSGFLLFAKTSTDSSLNDFFVKKVVHNVKLSRASWALWNFHAAEIPSDEKILRQYFQGDDFWRLESGFKTSDPSPYAPSCANFSFSGPFCEVRADQKVQYVGNEAEFLDAIRIDDTISLTSDIRFTKPLSQLSFSGTLLGNRFQLRNIVNQDYTSIFKSLDNCVIQNIDFAQINISVERFEDGFVGGFADRVINSRFENVLFQGFIEVDGFNVAGLFGSLQFSVLSQVRIELYLKSLQYSGNLSLVSGLFVESVFVNLKISQNLIAKNAAVATALFSINSDCKLNSYNNTDSFRSVDQQFVSHVQGFSDYNYYQFVSISSRRCRASNLTLDNLDSSFLPLSNMNLFLTGLTEIQCISKLSGPQCQQCSFTSYFGLCAQKVENSSIHGDQFYESLNDEMFLLGDCHTGYSGNLCDTCDVGYLKCNVPNALDQIQCDFDLTVFVCVQRDFSLNGDCYTNSLAQVYCVSCNSGYRGLDCTSCAEGYLQAGQICTTELLAGCLIVVQNLCQSCKVGFTLIQANENQFGFCAIQNQIELVKGNQCFNISQNEIYCKSCSISYLLVGNICFEKIDEFRGQCYLNQSVLQCLVCSQNYQNPFSGCFQCSQIAIFIYNMCYQQCKTCNGDCYMDQFNQLFCLSCNSGYVTTANLCMSCDIGYVSTTQRQCQQKCSDCHGSCYCVRFYTSCNIIRNISHPNSLQCDSLKPNFENASNCISNHILFRDNCIKIVPCPRQLIYYSCKNMQCLYVNDQYLCKECDSDFTGDQCQLCVESKKFAILVNNSRICVQFISEVEYVYLNSTQILPNYNLNSNSCVKFENLSQQLYQVKGFYFCFQQVDYFDYTLQIGYKYDMLSNQLRVLYNSPFCDLSSNCSVCLDSFIGDYCQEQLVFIIDNYSYNLSVEFSLIKNQQFITFAQENFSKNSQFSYIFNIFNFSEDLSLSFQTKFIRNSFGQCRSNFKANQSGLLLNSIHCQKCIDKFQFLNQSGFYGCFMPATNDHRFNVCYQVSYNQIFCESCSSIIYTGIDCSQCEFPLANFYENETYCQYQQLFSIQGTCFVKNNLIFCNNDSTCQEGIIFNGKPQCTKCQQNFILDKDSQCQLIVQPNFTTLPYSYYGKCYSNGNSIICSECGLGWTGSQCNRCDSENQFILSIDNKKCMKLLQNINHGYCYKEDNIQYCTHCFDNYDINLTSFSCEKSSALIQSNIIIISIFVVVIFLSIFPLFKLRVQIKLFFLKHRTRFVPVILAQLSAVAFSVQDQCLNQMLPITMTSTFISSLPFVFLLLFSKPDPQKIFMLKDYKHYFFFMIASIIGLVPDTLLSLFAIPELQNTQSYFICLALPITLAIYTKKLKLSFTSKQIITVFVSTIVPSIISVILITIQFQSQNFREVDTLLKTSMSLPVIIVSVLLTSLNIYFDEQIFHHYSSQQSLARISIFSFFYALFYLIIFPEKIISVFQNQWQQLSIAVCMQLLQFVLNIIILKQMNGLEFNMNMNSSVTGILLINIIGISVQMSRLGFQLNWKTCVDIVLSIINLLTCVVCVLLFYKFENCSLYQTNLIIGNKQCQSVKPLRKFSIEEKSDQQNYKVSVVRIDNDIKKQYQQHSGVNSSPQLNGEISGSGGNQKIVPQI